MKIINFNHEALIRQKLYYGANFTLFLWQNILPYLVTETL